MLQRILIFIIILLPLKHWAQDFSDSWEGHFSYNEIKDVTKGNNKIYAAADNAIFSLDTQTNEIEELSTINGLSGETISTIYYSEAFELLIIGYENGLIEIAFDNDENILTVVDIIDKPTIPATDKRINHFNAYQNVVYISTNYGISVFDLERLEFGDTYFIGNGGTQTQVNQTTIFNDEIYAACFGANGNGIRKAQISNPNLIDFQNWELINVGNWIGIETQEDKLYAIRGNRRIFEVINDVFNEMFLYATAPLDLRSVNGNLIVTTQNNVFVYDSSFNIISQVDIDPLLDTRYTTATIDADNIYIGTKDFGILKTSLANPIVFEEIHPDGPLLNNSFTMELENENLWLVYGGYGVFFDWAGGQPFSGISHYDTNEWHNIPYDSISAKINNPRFLSHIAINPLNSEQVYVSSYYSGLIKIENEEIVEIYDENNSTIVPFAAEFCLTTVSEFNENGTLWVANGRVQNPLNKFENNNWTSYDFSNLIAIPTDNLGFGDMVIGKDGTKWLASYNLGVVGFNETLGGTLLKSISKEDENMPTEFATAVALDNRNQLWIGTFKGLRVLYNTTNFFTDEDVRAEEIIIEEDGIAKELLFQQYITDIEVDGSNNKWIGTDDSGIFYFSSDGQNTIFHFTKENSPIPSNSIRDISLDDANGVVYIATNNGLVAFRSGSSNPFEDLTNAYAYPNPVRPQFNIVDEKVKIKDISENVNIKITDIEGNLVAEAQSRTNQRHYGHNLEIDGGTAYWNGKNLTNNIVASGVYLIMLSDLDTFETRVLKLMVVR